MVGSQIRAVPSSLAVARCPVAGSNATPHTVPVWPVRVRRVSPVVGSQIRAVPSSLAVARCPVAGSKATAFTALAWALSVRWSAASGTGSDPANWKLAASCRPTARDQRCKLTRRPSSAALRSNNDPCRRVRWNWRSGEVVRCAVRSQTSKRSCSAAGEPSWRIRVARRSKSAAVSISVSLLSSARHPCQMRRSHKYGSSSASADHA